MTISQVAGYAKNRVLPFIINHVTETRNCNPKRIDIEIHTDGDISSHRITHTQLHSYTPLYIYENVYINKRVSGENGRNFGRNRAVTAVTAQVSA